MAEAEYRRNFPLLADLYGEKFLTDLRAGVPTIVKDGMFVPTFFIISGTSRERIRDTALGLVREYLGTADTEGEMIAVISDHPEEIRLAPKGEPCRTISVSPTEFGDTISQTLASLGRQAVTAHVVLSPLNDKAWNFLMVKASTATATVFVGMDHDVKAARPYLEQFLTEAKTIMKQDGIICSIDTEVGTMHVGLLSA